MTAKIKNILIFVTIGAIFVLIYIFFIKPAPAPAPLISASSGLVTGNTAIVGDNSSIAKDFLALLLSVKNIKLNDSIFSDKAFLSLHDSSITLIPDGDEGRPNPFAPFSNDNSALAAGANTSNPVITHTQTSAPIIPIPTNN